jgi:hypothetical protein
MGKWRIPGKRIWAGFYSTFSGVVVAVYTELYSLIGKADDCGGRTMVPKKEVDLNFDRRSVLLSSRHCW